MSRHHRQHVDIDLRTNISHLYHAVGAVNTALRRERTDMLQSWRELFVRHNLHLNETHNYVVTSLNGQIVTSVDRRVRDHIRKFQVRITPYPVVLDYERPESNPQTPRGTESIFSDPWYFSRNNHTNNHNSVMRFPETGQQFGQENAFNANASNASVTRAISDNAAHYFAAAGAYMQASHYYTGASGASRVLQGTPAISIHEIEEHPNNNINPSQPGGGYSGRAAEHRGMPQDLLNLVLGRTYSTTMVLRNPQNAHGEQGESTPAVDLSRRNPPRPEVNRQEIQPVENRVVPTARLNIHAHNTQTVPANSNIRAAIAPEPASIHTSIVPAAAGARAEIAPAPVNRPTLIVPALASGSEDTAPANSPASEADKHMHLLSLEDEETREPPAIITNPPEPSAQGTNSGGSSLATSKREGNANASGPPRKVRKSLRLSKMPPADYADTIETEEPLGKDESAANIAPATNLVKKRGKRQAPPLIPKLPMINPSVANERPSRSYRSGKRRKISHGEQKVEEIDLTNTSSIHPPACPFQGPHACTPMSGNGLPTLTGSNANHSEENLPGTSARTRQFIAKKNIKEHHNVAKNLLSVVRRVNRVEPDQKMIQGIVNAYNMYKHANISETKTAVKQLVTSLDAKEAASKKSSSANNPVDVVEASVAAERPRYCASVVTISSGSDRNANLADLEDDLAALSGDNNNPINNAMHEGQQQVNDDHNQQPSGFAQLYNQVLRECGAGEENGGGAVGNMDLDNHVDQLNRQIAQVIEELHPVLHDMDPLVNMDNNGGRRITINPQPNRMQIDVVIRPSLIRRERANEVPQNNEQNHRNSGETAGERRHAHGVNPDNRRPRQIEANQVDVYGRNHAAVPNVGNGELRGAFQPFERRVARSSSEVRQPVPAVPQNNESFHFPQNTGQFEMNGYYRNHHHWTCPALFGYHVPHQEHPRSANQPNAHARYNMQAQAQQPQQNIQGIPPYINPHALADLDSYMRPLVTRFGLEEMRQVANSLYNIRLNEPDLWRRLQHRASDLCNFLRNLFG